MTLSEYRAAIHEISFGKRLPTALYVFREDVPSLGTALDNLVAQAAIVSQVGSDYNVLKLRTDELKLSFLAYPRFFDIAHPALHKAVTVDLRTGKARHSDYTSNLNPPILHRKESFFPGNHARRCEYEALTRQEEAAGLYERPETIGFKLNWERLLADKGLMIEGHSLRRAEPKSLPEAQVAERIEVHRHKTAMTRYDLSKPVKSLLEYGLLKLGSNLLDYGCGHGADVAGLRALGYHAYGWDPVHQPNTPKNESEIVNFGYVLNVIEDPAERLEALVDAYRHARRLLVVSGLVCETVERATASVLGDGVLTKRNTFQKYFAQQELQQYIEDALDTTALPVALGVFYVFRDPADHQDFLSARSRRAIDWGQISARIGLGGPQSLWKALYEEHRELLNDFGRLALALGRLPRADEFGALGDVASRLGSAKRALRAFVQGGGVEGITWDEIRVRFGIGQPPRRRWEILCDEHRELLDSFWSLMLQLGRLPEPEEFQQTGELRTKIGSQKQALRMFILKGGGEEVRQAAENRKRDLLVYVALANLRRRVPFGHLPFSLRTDIRAFFGN